MESENAMDDRLKVGSVTSVHGVHGEVKVFPTTDDVNRFKKLKKVILDTGKEELVLEIRSVKFFKNMVILGFCGIDNPDEAIKYKGADLLIERKDAVNLDKDEYFMADLLGMKAVSDDDKLSGIIYDVLKTGANDVYEIKLDDGRQFLLPAIHECILSIDVENKLMKFHMLEGLLD